MSGPSANDLLTGKASSPGGNGDRHTPAAERSDIALMKIMWARMGWPPPIESIIDVERNPGGRSEEQKRRPRIVPPGRSDAVLYYSPTNTAKLLADQYLLNMWKLRQVLLGAALDEGVRDLAISHQDDKDFMNGLVFRAMNRAKADVNADRGTARHKLAEKIDFGIEPGRVSPEMRRDIESYREATRGLEMILGEMFVVHDEARMGGTFDRVVYYQGRYYIADLKPPDSGFGQGEHAIQFAIYSRALAYNWNLAQHLLATNPKALPTTQLRTELPQPLDQDRAIVIYVPRGGIGRASTAFVDIATGWEAFEHSQWTRRWQSRTFQENLVTPFTPKAPPTVIDTAASGVRGLPGYRDRSDESVDRVEQLAGGAAPYRERMITDGRPVTTVPLPGDLTAEQLVRRSGGVTEVDETDPAHSAAIITRALRTSTTLEQLKAVYATHKDNGWSQAHTDLYKTRRVQVTGQPLPERTIA